MKIENSYNVYTSMRVYALFLTFYLLHNTVIHIL